MDIEFYLVEEEGVTLGSKRRQGLGREGKRASEVGNGNGKKLAGDDMALLWSVRE